MTRAHPAGGTSHIDRLASELRALAPSEHWWEQAACRGMNPAIFYATGAHDDLDIDLIPRAPGAEICATCVVGAACLRQALLRGERFGTWGGLTRQQRRQLLQRHPDLAARFRRRRARDVV